MITCICVTGSTELNDFLRAELLWRMVNSMHEDPGHPFELILVDNCDGYGPHRKAIDEIFETYLTVTHVIRNRQNQFHGGGVDQGVALADGELIVQITDDLEWKPGWLKDLVAPLLSIGPPISIETAHKGTRLIAAPIRGHNVSGRWVREIEFDGRRYDFWTNAAAYCWAFWRETFLELGPWRRAHFADTKWSRQAQRQGYEFVVPAGRRIATETNLNYLRPWDYRGERRREALAEKRQYLKELWEKAEPPVGLRTKPPVKPETQWPLKNPVHVGPGAYDPGWLSEQRARQDAITPYSPGQPLEGLTPPPRDAEE